MARKRTTDAQDQADLDALTREIPTLPPLEVTIQAQSAFQLCAILQLAQRHPDLPPNVRDFAQQITGKIREYFREHGAVATMRIIERGDNPAEDR